MGSATEEAARLFDTLRQWVDARGPAEVPIATGSAECKVCPVCVLLAALRGNNPEVAEQLAKAGEALLAAARALMAHHEHAWVTGRRPDVERIDVDE